MAIKTPYEVPAEMRDFAERSVEQARKAFDGFISAAHHAVSDIEGRATAARTGAKDVSEKAMTFAQRNIVTSFDFAQKLVQARDMQEIMRLQSEYIQSQMKALSDQAKELGETASKATQDTVKPQ